MKPILSNRRTIMLLLKKSIVTVMLFSAALFTATTAMAHIVDIDVFGLDRFNLAAFDLNVNYDDNLLTFDSYTLTNELGSFTVPDEGPEAEDWSLGDDGSGTVNIAVLSSLNDFSGQPDAFTLATLSFSGEDRAIGDISLSQIVLSDDFGNTISFTASGTKIYAGQSSGPGYIPIPGSIWLLGFGLGVAGIRRKLMT
jgi:hypothetical protein